ncbi:COG1359 Uncharacterized conserved protein [Rhabdaerophilaceae bacterium]
MIYVVATLMIKPGTLSAVLDAVRPCLVETRKEAGCISYDLNQDLARPDQLVFVERWETRAHLAAHFETSHLNAWRAAASSFVLERKVEIIHAETIELL